jgi:2,3-bisphosphoglycerate-independent phosphoglycerate mutase
MITKEIPRVLLVILDGFGEGPDSPGNAITQANMTFLNELKKTHAVTTLKASGNAVGLPEGNQGNSEVGHFTMGSGRITFQSLEMINQSIKSKKFQEMDMFKIMLKSVHENKNKALHLMGMISDEGVHAHIEHLFVLLEMAKKAKAFPIHIHAILDGRDVPEKSADIYLKQIQNKLDELELNEVASIATIMGRFYGMDRDSNWERTQEAYELIINGKGKQANTPLEAIQDAYENGAQTDYYVPPIVLNNEGTIKNNDALIFFNFRTDRSRQLTDALLNKKFDQFEASHEGIDFIAMGPFTKLAPIAFPAPIIKNNLTEYLSNNKIHQLRAAETEKYAHVTYFFNSQIEHAQDREHRLMVKSPKCDSFAEKPEMSAQKLTDELIKELEKKQEDPTKYQFVAVNYANADLVGHAGDLAPTIECCRVIDKCLSELIPAALKLQFTVIVTADHGNAEQMFYEDGSACPSHTTNPVIGLFANQSKQFKLRQDAGLQDISPTILELLNLEKPAEMTGSTIIQKQ